MSRSNGRLRIVLADDHEAIRCGVRSILRDEPNLQVVGEADNGLQALKLVLKLKPDIAILDVEMPGLNGLDLARRIREAVPRTEILIFTMHESEEMIRQVIEAGAHGLVLKSDLSSCLLRGIRALGHHELFFSPRVSSLVFKVVLGVPKESPQKSTSQSCPTPREREVITHFANGESYKQVAAALGIAIRTVDTYRTRIREKLGLHSASELVRYAVRNNYVEP